MAENRVNLPMRCSQDGFTVALSDSVAPDFRVHRPVPWPSFATRRDHLLCRTCCSFTCHWTWLIWLEWPTVAQTRGGSIFTKLQLCLRLFCKFGQKYFLKSEGGSSRMTSSIEGKVGVIHQLWNVIECFHHKQMKNDIYCKQQQLLYYIFNKKITKL